MSFLPNALCPLEEEVLRTVQAHKNAADAAAPESPEAMRWWRMTAPVWGDCVVNTAPGLQGCIFGRLIGTDGPFLLVREEPNGATVRWNAASVVALLREDIDAIRAKCSRPVQAS